MIYLGLKSAFKKPGCPVCRLLKEQEDRYLFNLLYENVNDGPTRNLIIESNGLCSYHAWKLQAREQKEWNDGLGVAIIYEDLVSKILGNITDKNVDNSNSQLHRKFFHKCFPRIFRREKSGSLIARRLMPKHRCHICHSLENSEKAYIGWLLKGLDMDEFKNSYLESDGLCLSHLIQALEMTDKEKNNKEYKEEHIGILKSKARKELEKLDKHLREYIRKHAWEFRNEEKYPEEQASWIRAIAFFAGESKRNI